MKLSILFDLKYLCIFFIHFQAASTCALFESDDAALTNCTNLSFICCKQRTGHAPSILTRFAGLNDVESFDKPEQFSVEKVENTLESIKFGFSEVSYFSQLFIYQVSWVIKG